MMTITEGKHPTENYWVIEGKDDGYPYIFRVLYLGSNREFRELCLELQGFDRMEWAMPLVLVAERVIICGLRKAGFTKSVWVHEPLIDIDHDKDQGITIFSGLFDGVYGEASVRDDRSYVDRMTCEFDGGAYSVATVRGIACLLRRARQHMEL